MKTLGSAELGACTFCAASYSNDQCGANGLPLTPNSIRILGRFQRLKTLEHPRLCQYLDLVRGKHERLIVASEHYKRSVADLITEEETSYPYLAQVTYEILEGLAYLHKEGIIHRNLSSENVLLDPDGHVKLSKYGMYTITGHGIDVAFPIGSPRYMAPEAVSDGPVQTVSGSDDQRTAALPPAGPKADVWSVGMILLELCQGKPIWPTLTLQQIFFKITSFVSSGIDPLGVIAHDHQTQERIKMIPDEMVDFIKQCLTLSVDRRKQPGELLKHPLFIDLHRNRIPYQNGFNMFSVDLRCKDLQIEEYDESSALLEEDHLGQRNIAEVYYLWQLAGGDLEGILKKAGLIRSRPPITKLGNFTITDGELFGERKDRSILLDDTVVVLSQEPLRQRLEKIDATAYYPLLEDEEGSKIALPTSPSSTDLTETSKLPLVIKENDVEYQFHRIILYERLLKAYPYKRAHIWKEARIDIPPLVRGPVWAAVLDVEGDVFGRYDDIDKETPTPTDRQIEVDIPRCHQYNELLSSPEGHKKFKRLLKAWVVSNTQYVYWQGLDSLCAPFLYLNFNDEAVAFACLSAFIPKYVHKFFLKDNSAVIQEYLAVFSHLIAFHDPDLSNHLDGIGFIPDLYAIPWFLTMYAHVFPLHKIFHLWDTLLLGNSSFPLCIGVAILQQLRDKLLTSDFNECILLFSDMPEIHIEKCVQESIRVFCCTPKSATYRQHARPVKKLEEKTSRSNSASYYSADYSEGNRSELAMEPLTIEELKTEKCARVSAEDMIELSELKGHLPARSPNKRNKTAKPKLLVVDVRSPEEYMRGTVPGSINIPFNAAFNPEGQLVPCPAVQTLNTFKNQVKVILGSRGKTAINFSEELVRLNYSKVCVLHKGIDALRPTGLLTVPTPEI